MQPTPSQLRGPLGSTANGSSNSSPPAVWSSRRSSDQPSLKRKRPPAAAPARAPRASVRSAPTAAQQRESANQKDRAAYRKARVQEAGGDAESALLAVRLRSQIARKRYRQVATEFAARHAMVLKPGATPAAQLDRALFQDLNRAFLRGDTRAKLDALFYAVRHHLATKSTDLPLSSEAQIGYRRSTVETARDPVVWERAVSIAAWFAKRPASAENTAAACWTLLGFDMYPRPADLGAVRVADVHVGRPSVKGIASKTCVTFNPSSRSQVSKTNTQDDTVVVSSNPERPGLDMLLKSMVAGRSAKEKVFRVTTSRMRVLLAEASSAMSLPLTLPHQLRHGGASHDGATGIGLEEIQSRGHWAAAASCRRYAKPGRYLRLLGEVAPAEQAALKGNLSALLTTLRHRFNRS